MTTWVALSRRRKRGLAEEGSECAHLESLHIARSGRSAPKNSQPDSVARLRYDFGLALTRTAGNPQRPAGTVKGTLQNIEAVVDGQAVLIVNEHCDLWGLKRKSSYSFHMIPL